MPKVFLIHGQDTGARNELAKFLRSVVGYVAV